MIFTVAAVIVNSQAFVDPRLDTSTPIVRDVLRRSASGHDSFELLTADIMSQSEVEIRNAVRNLIRGNSVDWILIVGGIGFEDRECTPEVCRQRHGTPWEFEIKWHY